MSNLNVNAQLTLDEQEQISANGLRDLILNDEPTASRLFELHLRPCAFGYFFRRCRNLELAEDLTQRTLFQLFTAIKSRPSEAPVEFLLRRIASRRWLDYLRGKPTTAVDLLEVTEIPDTISPHSEWSNWESDLLACKLKLCENHRELLSTFEICKFNVSCVATALGISWYKTEQRLDRMFDDIKRCLATKGWDPDNMGNLWDLIYAK